MKANLANRIIVSLSVSACLFSGCQGPNSAGVNPSKPSANKGYVDFYIAGYPNSYEDTISCGRLLSILESNASNRETSARLYIPKYSRDGIVRLAMEPGLHRFRIHVYRTVTEVSGASTPRTAASERIAVSVPVLREMVSPVRISIAIGEGQVDWSEWGVSYENHIGYKLEKRTLYPRTDHVYQLSAKVDEPIPFRPKIQMPYHHENPH